jgi:EmrB/QacA subfamily drug resistance transporter
VVAILGSVMAFIDGTVVNIALPAIEHALGADVHQMQWVVEAYSLLLAALVLVGGALGDRLGRRRVFVAGIVLFSLASAACAVAPGATSLIAFRAGQGIGAALLVPGSLALIGAAYRGEARGAAIGTWSAATSVASAAGPVLGGWLVAHASWRWLFMLNVPLGIVTAVLSIRYVGETRDTAAARGAIDFAGALLATLGLGCITWALLEAPVRGGLGSPIIVAILAIGVVILSAFVAVESKTSTPMVPLELFRRRAFAATNLATLLLYAPLGACLFFLPFNLIELQGYSPPMAGAALLPFVVLISLLSRWSGGLAERRGARLPLTVGPLFSALGFALLAVPSKGGPYWSTFFPGILVLGLGMGLTVAPLTATVIGAVEPRHAGVASGINNAVARAAGLLAIAGLGLVFLARFDDALNRQLANIDLSDKARAFLGDQEGKLTAVTLPPELDRPTRDAVRAVLESSFVSGFRLLMAVGASMAALAGMASWLLLGAPRGPRSRHTSCLP